MRRLLNKVRGRFTGEQATTLVNARTGSFKVALPLMLTERLREVNGCLADLEEFEYFRRLAKHANSYLDVGAGAGLHSRVVLQENPNCQVFALEPVREEYEMLKRNMQDIPSQRVHLAPLRVGRQVGPIMEPPLELASEYSSQVDSCSIDALCARHQIDHIDLIRICAPNQEREILQGAHHLLLDNKPLLFIETATNSTNEKLAEVLSFYGYKQCSKLNIPSSIATSVLVFAPSHKLHLVPTSEKRTSIVTQENGLLVRKAVVSA